MLISQAITKMSTFQFIPVCTEQEKHAAIAARYWYSLRRRPVPAKIYFHKDQGTDSLEPEVLDVTRYNGKFNLERAVHALRKKQKKAVVSNNVYFPFRTTHQLEVREEKITHIVHVYSLGLLLHRENTPPTWMTPQEIEACRRRCRICKEHTTIWKQGCMCAVSICKCRPRFITRAREGLLKSKATCECHSGQFELWAPLAADIDRQIQKGMIRSDAIGRTIRTEVTRLTDTLPQAQEGWTYSQAVLRMQMEGANREQECSLSTPGTLGTPIRLFCNHVVATQPGNPRNLQMRCIKPFLMKKVVRGEITFEQAVLEDTRIREEKSREKAERKAYDAETKRLVEEEQLRPQMMSGAATAAASVVLNSNQVQDALNNVNQATSKATVVAEQLSQLIDGFAPILETATGKANKAMDGVTLICDSVQKILSSVGEALSYKCDGLGAGACTRLTLCAYDLLSDDAPLTLGRVTSIALRVLSEFGMHHFYGIYKFFCKALTKGLKVQAPGKPETGATEESSGARRRMGGEEEDPEVELIAQSNILTEIPTIVSAILQACFGGEANHSIIKRILQAGRFLSALDRVKKTIAGVTAFVLEWLPEWLQEYIKMLIPSFNWWTYAKTGPLSKFNKLAARITAFQRDGQMVDLEVWDAYDKITVLIEQDLLSHGGCAPQLVSYYWNTKKMLEAMRFSTEERKHEPFVVYVSGAPGVGKSTLTEILACALTKVPLATLRQLIYYRAVGSEYYDGYKGKKQVVVYDDFFQDRNKGLDVLEVMQIVSKSQFRLNMSDITGLSGAGKKGDLYCSPYLILLSNTEYPQSPMIYNNQALHRRRHLFVEMTTTSKNIADWRFKVKAPVPTTMKEDLKWYGEERKWYGVKIGETGDIKELLQWVKIAHETFVEEKQTVDSVVEDAVTNLVFNGTMPDAVIKEKIDIAEFDINDFTPEGRKSLFEHTTETAERMYRAYRNKMTENEMAGRLATMDLGTADPLNAQGDEFQDAEEFLDNKPGTVEDKKRLEEWRKVRFPQQLKDDMKKVFVNDEWDKLRRANQSRVCKATYQATALLLKIYKEPDAYTEAIFDRTLADFEKNFIEWSKEMEYATEQSMPWTRRRPTDQEKRYMYDMGQIQDDTEWEKDNLNYIKEKIRKDNIDADIRFFSNRQNLLKIFNDEFEEMLKTKSYLEAQEAAMQKLWQAYAGTRAYYVDLLKKVARESWQFIKDYRIPPFVAAICVSAASFCTTLFVLKMLFFRDKQTEQMSGSHETNRATQVRSRPAHKIVHIHPQSQTNSLAQLATSLPRIRFTNLTSERKQICAAPVRGRVLLMNKHFWDNTDENDMLRVTYSNGLVFEAPASEFIREQMPFQDSDLGVMKGRQRDVVLVECPPKFANVRDCVSLYIKDEDLSNLGAGTLSLLAYRDSEKRDLQMAYKQVRTKLTYGPGGKYGTAQAWQYIGNTLDGDCGSVLMLEDAKMSRFLCGIHFAAAADYSNRAYGVIVTQEQLRDGLQYFEDQVSDVSMQMLMETTQIPEKKRRPEGNFNVVGQLVRNIPYINMETRLKPSPYFEAFGEHKTEPAILSPRDTRLQGKEFSPIVDGVNKYGGSVDVIPRAVIQEVSDSIIDSLNKAREEVQPREVWKVLTTEEAVLGIPTVPHMNGVDLSTSPGYPYNLKYKKKELLEVTVSNNERKLTVAPLLQAALDRREESARDLQRVPSYWVDTTKDERRPLEKIYEKPKTRVFTNPPVDLTILGIRYTASFASMFYQLRSRCFSGVGMNPYSKEWAVMIDYLREVGDYGFDLDHKNFDGKVPPECFEIVYKVMEAFYEQLTDGQERAGYRKERNVRKTLIAELINTYAIANGVLYQTACGMPSGCWLTACFNSIINEAYLRWMWIRLATKHAPHFRDLKYFADMVRTKVFGDDGVVAVHEDILGWFNQENVFAEFTSVGMTMTSARKMTGKNVSSVLDCSFLKNTTGVLRGQYVALLEFDVITEMVYWYRQVAFMTMQACVESTLQSALHFLYFYGRKLYNEYTTVLRGISIRECFPVTVLSYDYLDEAYTKNGAFYDMDQLFPFYRGGSHSQPWEAELLKMQMAGADAGVRNQNMTSTTSNSSMPGQEAQNTGDQGRADALVSETRAGVTLTEASRPQVVTYSGNSDKDARAQSTMREPAWNLEKMLGRHNYIQSIEWTTSAALGTTLATWVVPHDILLNDINTTAFNRFRFFKGKFRLRFQTNGMKFAAGRAIAWFVPYTAKAVVAAYQTAFPNNWTNLEHVMIDPAVSGISTLEVPFIFPYSWLDLPNNEAIGVVTLSVFNTLTLPEAAAISATIQVLFEVVDPEFKVPVISGPATPTRLRMQMFAGVGKSLDKVLEKAIPSEITGDPIDAIMGLAGLDAPSVAENPKVCLIRNEQYLTYGEGVQNFQRLQLYQSALTLCDEEHFSTKDDEMSIDFLLKSRRGLSRLQVLNWTTSNTPGTVLATFPVGPLMANNLAQQAAGTRLNPTMLDYISSKFTAWMGGIKFVFDGVLSAFHTGRIGVSFYPGLEVGDAPVAGADFVSKATSGYWTSLDAKDGVLHGELIAPFLSPTPWKPVYNGSQNGEFATACSSGTLQVWVYTPLKANDTISPSVDINIFVQAADDFQLNILAGNNSGLFAFVPPAPSQRVPPLRMQMATGGQVDLEAVTFRKENAVGDLPQIATGESIATPMAQVRAAASQGGSAKHFEENYSSLRDVCRRFADAGTKTTNYTSFPAGVTSGLIPICFQYDPMQDIMGTTANAGYITYFSRMYRFFRGSIRQKIRALMQDDQGEIYPIYRIRVTSAPVTDVVPAFGPAPDYANFSLKNDLGAAASGSLPIATMTYDTNALEVEFPYVKWINIMPTVNVQGEAAIDTTPIRTFSNVVVEVTMVPFSVTEGRTFTLQLETFVSLGDDARFGGFMGVPWWTINATTATPRTNLPNTWWMIPTPANAVVKPRKEDDEWQDIGNKTPSATHQKRFVFPGSKLGK